MSFDEWDEKIPLGISSCLIGEKVRFDGGHKQNRYILDTLGLYFSFKPFCPEVAIGMGVPRDTIRLVEHAGVMQAAGVKNPDFLVGDELRNIAEQQKSWHSEIFGYIVKKDSPSCGMERVKVWHQDQAQRRGRGLYTEVLMRNFPTLPVEEEGRLGDPRLRENFVQRIFVYKRWRNLLQTGVSWDSLTEFHARHKLILYSHNQDLGRKLGRELAQANQRDIREYTSHYFSQMMQILKITAKRSNHVNVLEHIRGYLEQDLDSDDKAELSDSIENYRLGLVPLIVPITLLRHHFRKFPNEYIDRSLSLHPHPDQLMLLNSL